MSSNDRVLGNLELGTLVAGDEIACANGHVVAKVATDISHIGDIKPSAFVDVAPGSEKRCSVCGGVISRVKKLPVLEMLEDDGTVVGQVRTIGAVRFFRPDKSAVDFVRREACAA